MQPHYVGLIVKQHLCILMESASMQAHAHRATHDCYRETVNKKTLQNTTHYTHKDIDIYRGNLAHTA